MGKLLRREMVSEWRENAITRGGTEKYYFVICFSVDTSTPELASMESTCFASVTGVAFAECNPPSLSPHTGSIQLRENRARQALSRRLSASSSTDISRVSDDAYRRDASLLPPRISSQRRSDKCDGRLRLVLQKRKERRRRRWNELRGKTGLFIMIEFRYWLSTCT